MDMNLNQARVIDPILTNHSRGYSQAGFIGDRLLPIASMPTRAAKRIEFGREAFRRYSTRRAPGTAIKRIGFGYEGKPVSLHQESLGAITPREHMEEANAVPGIDLLTIAVDTVMAALALEREIQQAIAARDATVYAATNKVALAGQAKWSDPASNPLADKLAAEEQVRGRTGRRPNTMALGARVASVLKKHPLVLDRFKHVSSDAVTNTMLAQYFDLNPENLLVGDAIYDQADGTSVDVWGNDAIFAYVPPAGQANINIPAFGYTYRLLGHPYVEQAHWDKDTKSWVNDVADEWSAEIVGPDAGFLFQGAAA